MDRDAREKLGAVSRAVSPPWAWLGGRAAAFGALPTPQAPGHGPNGDPATLQSRRLKP
jgi:hypothetical protein